MFWSLITLTICTIFFWIRWRKKRLNIFKENGIPGPEPNFITGNLREFGEKKSKCIDDWLKKYGNIFGFFLGGKPYIVCSDVEFLKIMQVKEFKSFKNRECILPDSGIPHKLVFNSIVMLKDEEWKTFRNIISTAFSSGKIKLLSTAMNEPIQIFLKKIESQLHEPFNILQFIKDVTFDITCKIQFGITTNVQEKETSKFIRSVYSLFHMNPYDPLVCIAIFFPEFEPLPTYLRRMIDTVKNKMNLTSARVIFDTCQRIIDTRKNCKIHHPDLMQIMLDAEFSEKGKEKLPTDYVIANTVLFMLVGYETTSSNVGWCMYHLANYPEMQEKVREEINENVQSNKEIEYTDLIKLNYLDQVISESLRISPASLVAVNRVCAKEFKYKNFTFPKGVGILAATSILQNDPNYWQNPKEFDPERFSPENRGNIDPLTYQPFGFGPRNCVGMKLAQNTMKMIIANVIRRYRLENCGDEEIQFDEGLFLPHPKKGIFVRATKI